MAISIPPFPFRGIQNIFLGVKTYYENEGWTERAAIWLQFNTSNDLSEFVRRCERISNCIFAHPDELSQNMLTVEGHIETSHQSLLNIVDNALRLHRF